LGLNIPLSVFAVSYAPALFYHQHEWNEATAGIGETVYLFYNGAVSLLRRQFTPHGCC
jgi:hypothetical protein